MTESGLGDILVGGRYYFNEEGKYPDIEGVASIKLPTADKDKGLGTGKSDAGIRMEASKHFHKIMFWEAGLGFTWMGDPAGIDYQNRWTITLESAVTLGKIDP